MITHVVLFKFLPGFTAASAPVQAFHAAMLELPRQITLIKTWRCGFNTLADAQAADYVLVAEFESQADLFAYFEHPAHVAAVCCLDGVAELQFADIPA